MQYYLDYPDNVKLLEDYTSQALEKYNKENGTTYEFDKIIKVNGEGCRDRIYYITLSVKNGKEKYFQVKMVTRLLRKSLKFPSSGQPRVMRSVVQSFLFFVLSFITLNTS